MSGFQVPYSSSPPSTPDRRSRNTPKEYSFGASNLSTTPVGPPPSSAGSFTPAGLPPSSVLGSSGFDSQYNDQPFQSLKFSKQTVLDPPTHMYHSPKSSPSVAPYVRSSRTAQRSGLSNEYKESLPNFQPADLSVSENEDGLAGGSGEQTKSYGQYGDNQYDLEDIDRMVDDMEEDGYYEEDHDMDMLRFDSSMSSQRASARNATRSQKSHQLSSSRLSRSRNDNILDFKRSIETSQLQPRHESMFGRIAKDMRSQMGTPSVNETDDLVLGTEDIITRLYAEGISANEDADDLSKVLKIIPSDLLKLWADYNSKNLVHVAEEYATAIGPGPRASKFAHANFLASLLLRLRHPGLLSPISDSSQSLRASLKRGSIAPGLEGKTKPIPLLLLEWMDDYHDPYPSQLDEIQAHKPSPSNHRLFWDTILNSLLRGRVVAVVNALKTAGWKHARTALENLRGESDEVGYNGIALANVERVIYDAIQVLQQCPGVRGDWDITSSDWTLFRLRISQSLENLKRFAEGRGDDRTTSVPFEAEHFGMSSMSQTYTGAAKKAESQVPWNIYQNLLTMYDLILGDASAIIENAQDWCEATIGLVVWWDQGKDDRRLALGRAHVSRDDEAAERYYEKLAESFYSATSESTDFQVNTLDPVEIGLASIFESDVEAVIGILGSYSGPVSAAVAEVASLGGWLPQAEGQNLITMESLDQDDMDVLGIDPSFGTEDVKDHTLITYAEALAKRGHLEYTPTFGRTKIIREGWEVAIEVLGRLNSGERSEAEVGKMIKDFPLESGVVVNKLWRLLNDLSMAIHAENVAEVYADFLAKRSHNYGEALWYYALAHKSKKVKDVLDLLISLSLIHSVAYPPAADLDDYLRRLISSPKDTLVELSQIDFEAAQMLHKLLSGYATLRKFYDLRDEESKHVESEQPKAQSVATKLEAATALVAVIRSADDNIHGGLYDESRGAVVSVDFLLVLLGEAMVFVNQPNSVLTPSQIYTLVKSVEDIQTVPQRIYAACNEFFQTVIASTQALKGSSPMDLLTKSTSSLSGAGSFSMVGSSMLASQLQRSVGSSGVLVKGNLKRGWDWRRGLTVGATSEETLKVLRFGLSKELARVWLQEIDNQ